METRQDRPRFDNDKLKALIEAFYGKEPTDRLSTLPAELHNRIYALTIPKNKTYSFNSRPQYPGICQTSRLFRHETLRIWRRDNEWRYRTRSNDGRKEPFANIVGNTDGQKVSPKL